MSHCVISIDIQEYLPNSLNFDGFSFSFRSDSKDFEEEIKFSEKNIIIHKTQYRREIRYSIKVIRNGSLVGISDFTIPSSVLSKKTESFSKVCNVTMTDSTKRLLFGNVNSSNVLKISVSVNIQYVDKPLALKQSHSLPKTNLNKMPLSPKTQALKNKYLNDLNRLNNSSNRDTKTPPINNLKRTVVGSSKVKTSGKASKNNSISGTGGYKYNKLNSLNTSEKKSINVEEEKEPDESVIDDELLHEVKEIDPQFKDFMPNYVQANPLGALADVKDVNELTNKTKENIIHFFEYQSDYYYFLKRAIELNNRLRELLVKNNEKFRTFSKKQHRLDEQFKSNAMRRKIIVDFHRGENKEINEVIPMKKKEIEVLKKVFSTNYKEADVRKFIESQGKESEEEKMKKMLVKILESAVNKYGPLKKLINETNSTPEEIQAASEMTSKLNLPNEENQGIKEEDEDNENDHEQQEEQAPKDSDDVSSNIILQNCSADQNDIKLNSYLNYFYSKRKIPKIMFKKTSTNNYEYGSQKIMIKVEGETIRVRCVGGYLLLDKFLEMNAASEERKQKLKNSTSAKNSSSTSKQKIKASNKK